MGLLYLEFFRPEYFPIHAAIVFVVGALWGSFFGLCISRIPAGESVTVPASYCFSCGSAIRWSDNIPLISYWMLRGRCRSCGTAFSSRHFWIELLSGILFVWVFWVRGYTWTLLSSWIFTGLLVIATFTDLDHWIIPDRISIGGTIIGVILAFIPFPTHTQPIDLGGPLSMLFPENIIYDAGPFRPDAWPFPSGGVSWLVAPMNALAGAAFGYAIMWGIGKLGGMLFRKEAMGGGDMKLFACIGAFLGYFNCVLVLFVSSALGSVIGIAALLFARRRARLAAPSDSGAAGGGPEGLAASAIASLYPEDETLNEFQRNRDRTVMLNVLTQPIPSRGAGRHLPFGPYLAAGAFLVMLYHPWILYFIKSRLTLAGGFE